MGGIHIKENHVHHRSDKSKQRNFAKQKYLSHN
ncbi:MAG: hypothetical protein ACI8V9_001047 [Flavobacteriaceae bacterium]